MLIRIILVCLLITVLGCSNKDYQLYTGTTNYGKTELDSNAILGRYYDETGTNCIKKGQIIDMRLQRLRINQIFEPWYQKAFGNNENELGIFVTIKEKPFINNTQQESKDDQSVNKDKEGEKVKDPDRRLVYASAPREANSDLNQINTRVYLKEYNGGDLSLKIEVVEFDKGENQVLQSILDKLVNAAKDTYASAIPSQYTALVDELSNTIFGNVAKDDLIATYEMEFLPCGTISRKNQVFLKTGDLLFVRTPQGHEKDLRDNYSYDYVKKELKLKKSNEPQSYAVFTLDIRNAPK